MNNQVNCIHEEIKNRLKSGNNCCHLVQNCLSSSLLSKNKENKMYRTVILLFVSCGHETSSLRLREGRRSRVFDNRVLRKIFGPKRDEVTGKRRRLIHSQSARKEFVTLSLSLLKMCSSQQYTCGTLIFIQHVWNPLRTDLCLPGLLVRI